ncbi:MAG: VCBS repeat-containing protein [Candidatus Manganitrophus sp.]|nr:VCBS repeat-containing protein [Candidatus Manganitrophus sp.]
MFEFDSSLDRNCIPPQRNRRRPALLLLRIHRLQHPVQTPQLKQTLAGGGEGWLGSPAAADLDGDGRMEIIAPRGGFLFRLACRWNPLLEIGLRFFGGDEPCDDQRPNLGTAGGGRSRRRRQA